MAVDVDLEGLYDIGVMTVVKDEEDAVLIRFRKPELFIEGLVGEGILIDQGTILVFDGELESVAFGVGVGHVEDQHVVLRAEVFYRRLRMRR